MPDHLHALLLGLDESADQQKAVARFRLLWSKSIASHPLQLQPYEHLLRESEREKSALYALVQYILQNPVRKGLVAGVEEWPFSGSLVPGFAELDPRKFHFWENFWNAYSSLGGGELA